MLDRAEIVSAHEAGVRTADHDSDFYRQISALEAAENVVCDIERAMVDFEPRSIADLRLQVELALHQEVIDYGMDENLPRLICERFLRLIPAQSVSRVDRTKYPAIQIYSRRSIRLDGRSSAAASANSSSSRSCESE
jgi:hypothetical protein